MPIPSCSLAICSHAIDGKKINATLSLPLSLSGCPGEIIRIIDRQITGLQSTVKIFALAASEDIVAKALAFLVHPHKDVGVNYNLVFIAPLVSQLLLVCPMSPRFGRRRLKLLNAIVLQCEQFRDVSLYQLPCDKPGHKDDIAITVSRTTIMLYCA
jgi:hypothetical protein